MQIASENRWPALLALFTLALLYQALPTVFYWGPRGLMIGFVAVLTIPMIITHYHENHRTHRVLALSVNVWITLYIIISVARLVIAELEGQIGPKHLLLSSVVLWVANILLFALWYWNLDAGGPTKRASKEQSGLTAFMFPQTQISLVQDKNLPSSISQWMPNFIDYLFLAFNTSTAFSPTDTPVLSRWAKCMSMIQALISLTIVLMLAARAVNILSPDVNYFVS
ncbi:hypothetical protein [Legionella massiliensis]|nr:hypothetical protein [Legionella massiliensis]